MSAEEKYTILTTEKIPAVHEAGKRAGQDDLWAEIINTRTSFESAFERWLVEYIRPPIKIVPKTSGIPYMCRNCKNLKIIEAAYFDLSQMTTGTTMQNGLYYAFYNCESLTEIEDIGIGAVNPIGSFSRAFANCTSLHTIAKITVAETSLFAVTFDYCRKLANIQVAGTIGTNGLNLQWSPLTHDSLMSIINALADKTADTSGTTWTVTLGEDNIAKLTADEQKIAKDKGWNLA